MYTCSFGRASPSMLFVGCRSAWHVYLTHNPCLCQSASAPTGSLSCLASVSMLSLLCTLHNNTLHAGNANIAGPQFKKNWDLVYHIQAISVGYHNHKIVQIVCTLTMMITNTIHKDRLRETRINGMTDEKHDIKTSENICQESINSLYLGIE